MYFQVIFDAGPRQCGISDHDGPAGGDGVRHRGLETAAVRPHRQKPGEQKPSQAAAQEVRKIWREVEQIQLSWINSSLELIKQLLIELSIFSCFSRKDDMF